MRKPTIHACTKHVLRSLYAVHVWTFTIKYMYMLKYCHECYMKNKLHKARGLDVKKARDEAECFLYNTSKAIL